MLPYSEDFPKYKGFGFQSGGILVSGRKSRGFSFRVIQVHFIHSFHSFISFIQVLILNPVELLIT